MGVAGGPLRTAARRALAAAVRPVLCLGWVRRGLMGYLRRLAGEAAGSGSQLRYRRALRVVSLLHRRPTYAPAQLHDGSSLMVDASDTLGLSVLATGTMPESAEVSLALRLLKPGDTCFDIGANVGVYTVAMARRVGSSGRVHAFEPSPETFAALRQSVEMNGLQNVSIRSEALSDAVGEAELAVTAESGLTGLGDTGRGTVLERRKVATATVDSYVERHGLRGISLIKLDVEGYEGHVLRGAAATLQREQDLGVLVELSERNFSALGFSVERVISWLGSLGYGAWKVDPVAGRAVPLDAAGLAGSNYLIARPTWSRLPEALESQR